MYKQDGIKIDCNSWSCNDALVDTLVYSKTATIMKNAETNQPLKKIMKKIHLQEDFNTGRGCNSFVDDLWDRIL